MAELISNTKGLLITPIYDTYVPDLGDSANIQNAFELFYYGNSTDGNTIDATNSIYSSLVSLKNQIDENDITTHADATAAHGATGEVVGTTNAQTLTNKTLTSPTITSPTITGGTINGGVALTVDSTELNKLDGVTATTAELNYVAGVTSAIQTQINLKPTLTYNGTPLNRNIFVQATQPTATNIGDIWIDF